MHNGYLYNVHAVMLNMHVYHAIYIYKLNKVFFFFSIHIVIFHIKMYNVIFGICIAHQYVKAGPIWGE